MVVRYKATKHGQVELTQDEQSAYELMYDPLRSAKNRKLMELNDKYNSILSDAHCNTPLGFPVDSGYENLIDFKEGLSMQYLTVMDYNNQPHDVSAEQMQTIIDAIREWGLAVKLRKWALREEINNATLETIDAIDVTTGWPE